MANQVVVFDLGEVLSRPVNLVGRLAKTVEMSKQQFADSYWEWRSDYDQGLAPLEYWANVLDGTEAAAALTQERAWQLSMADCRAWAQLAAPEIRVLQVLKERGVKLVLLSNSPLPMGDVVRSEAWADLFDAIFISAEVGLAKPDPRIFSLVEEELGIGDPSGIVFFDDRPENIDGARVCGWDAVLWNSPDQMTRELAERGLLPLS